MILLLTTYYSLFSTSLPQSAIFVFNKGERGEISVLFHFLIIRFVEEEFSYQRASSRRGWSQEQ